MIDKLKYQYIKKSNSELKSDEIVNNLSLNLWNGSGYATAYYLGAINQLKFMVSVMKEPCHYTKNDILGLIGVYKEDKNVSNEIKNLIDMILEEFDYKETTK